MSAERGGLGFGGSARHCAMAPSRPQQKGEAETVKERGVEGKLGVQSDFLFCLNIFPEH